MKKIFYLIFGIFIFISCSDNTSYKQVDVQITETGEYLNICNCRYYKIKVVNHDVYQYKFSTYFGTGSDIIHFEDLCNYCKNNNKQDEKE